MATFDLPTAPVVSKTNKGVEIPNTFSAARLRGGAIPTRINNPLSVPSNWEIVSKKDEKGNNIEGQIIATSIKDPNLTFEGTPAEFSEALRELANE